MDDAGGGEGMGREGPVAATSDLILRSREAASRRMGHGTSWFETRLAALLTMRVGEAPSPFLRIRSKFPLAECRERV